VSEDVLNADIGLYGNTAAADSPPPPITSDPLAGGGTPIEALLRALGLAANTSDPLDDAAGFDEYAGRDAAMADAAEGFANQDGAAGTQMSQLPQMAAGIAGGIAGAIAGALQPLMQLPTQFAQGAGQALQAGTALMSAYRGADPAGSDPSGDFGSADYSGDEFSDDGGDGFALDGADSGSSVGGGDTTPMAVLGPAPVPSASTAPASAPPLPSRAPSAPPSPAVGAAGMAGMPMIPPGPLTAAADKAAPAETKRVSAPAVRNGAPVQGRIISPPTPPAPRTIEGRPVEARRIVVGDDRPGSA